jgi:hypothetical protein
MKQLGWMSYDSYNTIWFSFNVSMIVIFIQNEFLGWINDYLLWRTSIAAEKEVKHGKIYNFFHMIFAAEVSSQSASWNLLL